MAYDPSWDIAAGVLTGLPLPVSLERPFSWKRLILGLAVTILTMPVGISFNA